MFHYFPGILPLWWANFIVKSPVSFRSFLQLPGLPHGFPFLSWPFQVWLSELTRECRGFSWWGMMCFCHSPSRRFPPSLCQDSWAPCQVAPPRSPLTAAIGAPYPSSNPYPPHGSFDHLPCALCSKLCQCSWNSLFTGISYLVSSVLVLAPLISSELLSYSKHSKWQSD